MGHYPLSHDFHAPNVFILPSQNHDRRAYSGHSEKCPETNYWLLICRTGLRVHSIDCWWCCYRPTHSVMSSSLPHHTPNTSGAELLAYLNFLRISFRHRRAGLLRVKSNTHRRLPTPTRLHTTVESRVAVGGVCRSLLAYLSISRRSYRA